MKKQIQFLRVGSLVIFLNLFLYLVFCLVYLSLFNQDPNNFFTLNYNGQTNLNNFEDIFYFGACVHCGFGSGDIVARSSAAKAAVSIHLMSSFIMNAGLLLYYVRRIV